MSEEGIEKLLKIIFEKEEITFKNDNDLIELLLKRTKEQKEELDTLKPEMKKIKSELSRLKSMNKRQIKEELFNDETILTEIKADFEKQKLENKLMYERSIATNESEYKTIIYKQEKDIEDLQRKLDKWKAMYTGQAETLQKLTNKLLEKE